MLTKEDSFCLLSCIDSSNEDLTLIKQGLLELDKLGNFGRSPSDLLHKLEQELGG